MKFDRYDPTAGVFDEMFEAQGRPRPGCSLLAGKIDTLTAGELARRQLSAERALLAMGITFNVYGDGAGLDKIMPFDLVPRIVPAGEWSRIERGLAQRIRALNAFLSDVYGAQKIVKDGVVPRELIESGTSFQKACVGLRPPRDVWCHVTGTDLVRDKDGEFYVLEDNLRCPSGVSYVLENRRVMKRTFPHLFTESRVRPVDEYPGRLLAMLEGLAQKPQGSSPVVVVLTPGKANSAYFEHSFLAQQMGVELVEGQDLTVRDQAVWMRTTKGLRRVDVIYRRIDDAFLDPKAFRADSLLGIPGIYEVYKHGGVALANAPGTGIADDKVIYAYVTKMIRYYLGEDAILPNVPTYVCWDEKDRAYVLQNLDKLVVKAANESGGYGMLIGPCASAEERAKFGDLVRANPRNYIAQPTLSLSQVPVIVGDHFEGRHVDLRPYVLYGGDDVYVMPGGLTRVALRKGSLVVNSSQGGGSKDTWVLHEPRAVVSEPLASSPSLWQWQSQGGQSQSQDGQSQTQGAGKQSQSQSSPTPPAVQTSGIDPARGGE
ncbi:MAG: circularly permuted type 2 ATP-grasp protein [Polyangiales bacterium]